MGVGVGEWIETDVGESRTPVAALTDSYNTSVRVCETPRRHLSAQPSLKADAKGAFAVENEARLDFQHTDRRLHSFTLSESSFSTSFLMRRSMKGFRIICSLESWSET